MRDSIFDTNFNLVNVSTTRLVQCTLHHVLHHDHKFNFNPHYAHIWDLKMEFENFFLDVYSGNCGWQLMRCT